MKKSILAGIFISFGCLAFLKIGGILGAFLFSFGLLGVLKSASLLYTGKIWEEDNPGILLAVLILNVFGCFISGAVSYLACPERHETAKNIIATRINDGIIACFIKGAGCGVIMTTAVQSYKDNNYWPLLLGIPLFILTGFYHSVADMFYFILAPSLKYLLVWIFIVLGNWIGGKIFFLWIKR